MKNECDNLRKKVVVIGMGYVGFPLACAIAKNKIYEVYGFDIDPERIGKINRNISPIGEDSSKRDTEEFGFKASINSSILGGFDFSVVCVPTPVYSDKKPDLTPVIEATKSISQYLESGQLISLESTVNPGVCEEVMLPILERTGLIGGVDFDLVHCPERINPGDKKYNVFNIPRNIGGLTKEGTKRGAEFYRSFIHAPINEISSIKAAEATKIVENTFRDVNIAFVNELAQSFDKMGIDLFEVIGGSSNKPFGFMPHWPGCGVGGHCIAVDPYYLIQRAEEFGFDHRLLKIAREVNNFMPKYTVSKFVNAYKNLGIEIKGANVGLLGLSYKPNVGDMRESPALEIREELKELGANVLSCDPHCNSHADSRIERILDECHGLIIATSHDDFLGIKDWKNIKVIVDGRNCLDPNEIRKKNIQYFGIGRGN